MRRVSRAFSKRGRCAFRIDGNDFQIGTGRLIRLAAALFPIPQGAERNMIARRKLFLRQLQRPADDLDAGHFPGSSELFGGKWRIVGIGKRVCFGFFVGHGVKVGPVGQTNLAEHFSFKDMFFNIIFRNHSAIWRALLAAHQR